MCRPGLEGNDIDGCRDVASEKWVRSGDGSENWVAVVGAPGDDKRVKQIRAFGGRVFAIDRTTSELEWCASGGGTHVYISGTNLGTAFAPPAIYLGDKLEVECAVQPFTSSNNRLHCIIQSANVPQALCGVYLYPPRSLFPSCSLLSSATKLLASR